MASRFRHAFANLYLTPHRSQTAPPHSDDRDVFILQLHGAKRWHVWPPAHAGTTWRPFTDEQAGKDVGKRLDPERLGKPLLDCLLEPGAVLYIPRSALHVARSEGDDCSLHLTVAVPTADLCLSSYALHAVAATCFDTRAFRRSLPLGPLPDGKGAGGKGKKSGGAGSKGSQLPAIEGAKQSEPKAPSKVEQL